MLLKILKEKLEILKKIKRKTKEMLKESRGVSKQPTKEIELRPFILETEKVMGTFTHSQRVQLKLLKRALDSET